MTENVEEYLSDYYIESAICSDCSPFLPILMCSGLEFLKKQTYKYVRTYPQSTKSIPIVRDAFILGVYLITSYRYFVE